MKPILFNTEMVRAILESRKTVTRRVVKLKYSNTHLEMFTNKYGTRLVEKQNEVPGVTAIKNPDGTTTHTLLACIEKEPPYRPGDILYVRETFKIDYLSNIPGSGRIHYKADDTYSDFTFAPERYEMMRRAQLKPGWRPNENMPREVVRIFLRVTDIRVERLKDITELDILEKEGVAVDFPQPKPSYLSLAYTETRLKPAVRKAFADLWDSTIKPADRALYGWDANPWVRVIEFERTEKP